MKILNNYILIKIIDDGKKSNSGLVLPRDNQHFIKVEVLQDTEEFKKGDKLICKNYCVEAFGYILIKNQDVLIKL